MKTLSIASFAAACLLGLGSAQALTPASSMPLAPQASTDVEQAQYYGPRPGWDRPGFRGRGPRVVCRTVERRSVDRFGRVRIVEREVCRPRRG